MLRRRALMLFLAGALAVSGAMWVPGASAQAGDIEWVRQFGGVRPASEVAQAVDAHGNVYVFGRTDGALPGHTSAGSTDAFIRKYDADGNEAWTRQFGSASADQPWDIVVDASSIYVSGRTEGTLPGQTRAGSSDAFVRKYDADGNEVWTRQFGTIGGESGNGVAMDASGIYVAGFTSGTFPGQANAGGNDAFVRKYDRDGNAIWTRQFGTPNHDSAFAVAADASGVYLAGPTNGTLPGQTSAGGTTAFVRKYDADGNEAWTRQFGSSGNDQALAIAVGVSGVYVAGETASGGGDAFVGKYDVHGNQAWTRRFGTGAFDSASAVAVDGSAVYVVGRTGGALPGQTSAGGVDAFVRKYDADGIEAWTRQFGTPSFDQAFGAGADGSAVYVAGQAGGALPGQTSGGSSDAFVRRYGVDGAEVWTRQFGGFGPASDIAQAVDAVGNVYVSGFSDGTLPGETSAGGRDAFVRKYDPDGTEVWTRQFGTSGFDQATRVAVDASGVYVVGLTDGTFPGQTRAGGPDTFVRKYDQDGNEVWTRQFGTASTDVGWGVALDSSGVYVAGDSAGDAFVRKFDLTGSELWARQFGTSTVDRAFGIAVNDSAAYVVGLTQGTLAGQTSAGDSDAFIRKYDADGNEIWTRQFGSSAFDRAFGVAANASGVYATGLTNGSLPGQASAGSGDAFVRKYDADGNESWTRQFGSSNRDEANGVAVTSSAVYVAGLTVGTLPGQTSAGGTDAFIRGYDSEGHEVWTRQFGTPGGDQAIGVSVDVSAAALYASGSTTGTFAGETSAGGTDAFVAKLAVNASPAVSVAAADVAADEGAAGSASGAFADPDGDPLTISCTCPLGALTDNGDGSWSWSGTPPEGPATFTVTVTAEDPAGASTSDSFTVTVANVAPTVDAITAPIDPVLLSTQIAPSANFSDAGVVDTHTAVWDWGDGTTSSGIVAETGGAGTVSGTHTYTSPGVYTLTLTVTDDDGASDSATFEYVVVYDPEGGFVTGAGSIDSPAGAYSADPTLAGRARFGFVSRYQHGATTPTGETQFDFRVAELNFRSTEYQWLVVAGAKAQYKGSGTINGAGDYGFLLTVTDGQLNGGGGQDTFRIKIWDKNTGAVVYDNQPGESDDADATTAITSGAVVIHK